MLLCVLAADQKQCAKFPTSASIDSEGQVARETKKHAGSGRNQTKVPEKPLLGGVAKNQDYTFPIP